MNAVSVAIRSSGCVFTSDMQVSRRCCPVRVVARAIRLPRGRAAPEFPAATGVPGEADLPSAPRACVQFPIRLRAPLATFRAAVFSARSPSSCRASCSLCAVRPADSSPIDVCCCCSAIVRRSISARSCCKRDAMASAADKPLVQCSQFGARNGELVLLGLNRAAQLHQFFREPCALGFRFGARRIRDGQCAFLRIPRGYARLRHPCGSEQGRSGTR